MTLQLTRRHLLGLAPALPLALAGCASPDVGHYAAEKPALDLRRYFDGLVTAHGMFSDRSGEVKRRFTVAMQCSWKGDDGVLDEQFSYSDGERQRAGRGDHDAHGQGRYVAGGGGHKPPAIAGAARRAAGAQRRGTLAT